MFSDPSKLLGDPIGGRLEDSADPTGTSVAGIGLDVMNDIITKAYGKPMVWALYSIDVPKPSLLKEVKELHDQAVWSNVRKGKLHMIFIDGVDVWGDMFARVNLRVLDSPKVAKRVAGLMSSRALSKTVDHMNIKEIPQDAFTGNLDLGENLEMVLDGAGVLRNSIFEDMFNMWEDRVTGVYHSFQIDSMARRFEEAVMVNGRCFTPNGVLKGNWYIMDDDMMDAMYGKGYDLVVPEGSYKAGVFTGGEFYLTAEVQQWHDTVNNNIQADINLAATRTDAFNTEIAKDFFSKAAQKVESGTMLDRVADIMNDQADTVANGTVSTKLLVDLGTRWSAAEWVASGLDIRQSPALLTGSAGALTRRVIKSDPETGQTVDYKLPLPCAWYCQLISESAARMYGFKGSVTDGEARVWASAHMIVITDTDYIAHYVRFGGCDLDDFFQILFRTYKGERCIIALRSPNGWGEYGVFKVREGDIFPKWIKADGSEEVFPEVKGTLPLQLDKALIKYEDLKGEIKDNMCVLLPLHKDLPADQQDSSMEYTHLPITREDGWKRVVAATETTVSAGMMVNAVMFYFMVMRRHLPITFGVLETFIDLPTQEDMHPEDAARLRFLAHYWVNYVVQSGRPMDKQFFENRSLKSMLVPTEVWERHNFQAWATDPSLWVSEDAMETMAQMWAKHKEPLPKLNLVTEGKDAFFSIRLKHVEELANKFKAFTQDIANHATPPEGLMDVGALAMGDFGTLSGKQATGMSAVLRHFRSMMGQAWDDAKSYAREYNKPVRVDPQQYQKIFEDISSLVTSYQGREFNDVVKFNRVLGLAAASYKYRVSYLRCQYKGCSERANVNFDHRGQKFQVCSGHSKIVKTNPAKRKNLEDPKLNDNAVTNREVFKLYMDALRFFGIAAPLGKMGDEALEPIDSWFVNCEGGCGRSATITDRVKYQRFVTQGSLCNTCFSNTQA